MSNPADHEAREEAARLGQMLGSALDRTESDLLRDRGDGPAELVDVANEWRWSSAFGCWIDGEGRPA